MKRRTNYTGLRHALSLPLALILLVMSLSGCGSADDILLWEFRSETPATAYNAPVSATVDESEFALRYGYSKLGKKERELYAEIKRAVFALEGSVSADGYGYDMFKRIFAVFCADYPECFWVSGDWTAKGYESGGVRRYTEFSPNYRYTKAEVRALQKEIDVIINEFLSSVPENPSDYEKMLAVYEFIATYTKYDNETARKIGCGVLDEKTDRSCSIDGYFLDKLAVCSGFSKATQLLLYKLGTECAYVTGKASGGSHSWNLVKLDGEYYYVDTTWAATWNEKRGTVSYEFFCLTTEEISYDHTLDKKAGLSECDATVLNYYVYNGLIAEDCDEQRLAMIIRRAFEDKGGESASFKFANAEIYEQAYKLLFGSGKIFSVLNEASGTRPSSISYSSDEGRLVITVYPKFKNAA